ncbi:MAG: M43 family zinc metalloprotease [Chitinophagales bacterium]
MKKSLFPLLLFIISVTVSAQQNWCATTEIIKRQIAADPQLAQQYANALLQLKQGGEQRAATDIQQDVYVPIVFHIIHNGDAIGTGENITDAQVLSQIDALNRDYNALDPANANVPSAFVGVLGNPHIHFCLARFDPNGTPTTGILREQFTQTSWNSDSIIDNYLKPSTIWDHTRYLNIWSVRMGGQLVTDGVLAYSSFPFFGGTTKDGVVARYNTIGTTGTLLAGYNLGKTITHEVGHWFGLQHVWGDDSGKCAGEQGAGNDGISDTPDQADMNFGCPSFPHVSCTGSAPNGDMFMNYMDYTDDACRNMFTQGQVSRMNFVLDNPRSALKNASTQCFYELDAAVAAIVNPADTVCSLSVTPVFSLRNEGTTTITSGTFYYQVNGNGVQIQPWNGSLAPQATIDVVMPAQIADAGANTIDVTFTNVNGQGADNYNLNDSKDGTFFARDGGIAASLPVTESFEGNFPQTNWTIYNPNNDLTWQTSLNGAYGLSNTSVVFDNAAYASNPNKKRDAIITDAYDFSNVPYPQLKFDLAYAQKSASLFDTLNLYYSLNCGSKWTRFWSQSGSTLATAADQTAAFTPAPNEWKTVTAPLPFAAGKSTVTFKFENVSGWGNALYLDNINLDNNQALGVKETEQPAVRVYPNPTSGIVAIQIPDQSYTKLIVTNTLGETVAEQNISNHVMMIDMSSYGNGMYFLRFSGAGKQFTHKLLLAK